MGPHPHSNAWPELCGGLPSGWVLCWPSCPVPTRLHLPTEKLWTYHPITAALGSLRPFHDCWVHFKFDLFEEDRLISEKECLAQGHSVCVCVCVHVRERGQGGGVEEREKRGRDTQRLRGWPMNEQLEVGERGTWTLGSCPAASLLGNRLLGWGSLL